MRSLALRCCLGSSLSDFKVGGLVELLQSQSQRLQVPIAFLYKSTSVRGVSCSTNTGEDSLVTFVLQLAVDFVNFLSLSSTVFELLGQLFTLSLFLTQFALLLACELRQVVSAFDIISC